MARKSYLILSSIISALILNVNAVGEPDPDPDVYTGIHCGWGLDAEKVSEDEYRDVVSGYSYPWLPYCSSLFVNNNTQQPPYFTWDQNVELVGGEEAKFGQLRPNTRDLAIANGEVEIYRNNQDGNLPWIQTLSARDVEMISWGRVDENVYEDLVGTANEADYVYIYYANDNGTGTFNPDPMDFHVGCAVWDLDLANINNDGLADLIITSGPFVRIFANDGAGSFDPDYQQISSTWDVHDFVTGDVDGDGYDDLVISAWWIVRVFLNDQSGQFVHLYTWSSFYGFYQIALGQFENESGYPDGYLDLASTNHNEEVEVYLNLGQGNGYFDDEPTWTGEIGLPGDHEELIYADLNGKGAMSLLFTGNHVGSGWLCIFKDNSNPPPCPPRNFQGEEYQGHPRLSWQPNDEDDIEEYWLYREITDPYEIPQTDQFEVIATFPHDEGVYWYVDDDVWLRVPNINCTAWYFVTALDNATPEPNESLPSDIARFLGLYHPQSDEGYANIAGSDEPGNFSISAAPNPFNPVTTLNFTLPEESQVELNVYDLSGRAVASLFSGWCEAGTYNVRFEGYNLPSGVYIYHLEAGKYLGTGKIILMK